MISILSQSCLLFGKTHQFQGVVYYSAPDLVKCMLRRPSHQILEVSLSFLPLSLLGVKSIFIRVVSGEQYLCHFSSDRSHVVVMNNILALCGILTMAATRLSYPLMAIQYISPRTTASLSCHLWTSSRCKRFHQQPNVTFCFNEINI
jgi:hypothetical protein